MTLSAYLDTKWEADVATISGWGDLGRFVSSLDDDYPELRGLLERGWSGHAEMLANEIELVMDIAKDEEVRDVLRGLLETAQSAKEGQAVIISDGLGDNTMKSIELEGKVPSKPAQG